MTEMYKIVVNKSIWLVLALSVWLAACHTLPPEEIKIPLGKLTPDFMVSKWEMLPDWATQELSASWPAMQQSCRALRFRPVWIPICAAAAKVGSDDVQAQRVFYETWFTPYQVFNPDGTDSGLITGYYEPLLKGSRTPGKRFAYPIYGPPDDMLDVDMGDLFPQFRGQHVRGRLQGKRVVPYFNRAEIDAGLAPALQGHELFWVENPVELFFLQIQGSGRIELEDGKRVKIGYAEQNGHGYASIGRKLIDMGELKPEEASMQGIKNWAEKNPERLFTLLGQNPSYVFFRELPDTLSAPPECAGSSSVGGRARRDRDVPRPSLSSAGTRASPRSPGSCWSGLAAGTWISRNRSATRTTRSAAAPAAGCCSRTRKRSRGAGLATFA